MQRRVDNAVHFSNDEQRILCLQSLGRRVSEHDMPPLPSADALQNHQMEGLQRIITYGPASLAYLEQVGLRPPSVLSEDPLIVETARQLLKRAALCSDLQSDCDTVKTPQTQPTSNKGIDTKKHAEPLWQKLDIMLEQARKTAVPECKEVVDADHDGLLFEFWELYHRQIGKTMTTQMAKVRAMNASKDVDSNPSGLRSTSRKILQEYHCFEELEREGSPSPLDFAQSASKGTDPRASPVGEDIEEASSSHCSSVDSFEEASEPDEPEKEDDVALLPMISQEIGIRRSTKRMSRAKRTLAARRAENRPRHVPATNFKGFDDYKQKQELAKSEKLTRTTHASFSSSTQNWLTSSVEKPQYAMSAAAREHKQACQFRLRRDLQQERPGRNFHRPWSREKHIEHDPRRVDESVLPLERFAKVCCRSGVHPHPASIRFLAKQSQRLDLRASGYGDADILALTAAMTNTSHQQFESIDIGENRRLTDASISMLLKALVSAHAKTIQVLKLDNCQQLSKETLELCNYFLEGPLFGLQVLDLSGIKIHMYQYMRLSEALRNHAALKDVRLADTGLGSYAGEGVIPNLMSNRRIEALDISWNSLDTLGFSTVGQGLARHQKLKKLALANTGSVSDHSVNGSPLLVFLEFLALDKSLTSLDISNNALNHYAPLVLESTARQHPNLSRLDLSRNPLGVAGMRSLLRLVASEGCPNLKDIVIAECTSTKELNHDGPYDGDPSGYYNLDLEQPGQRAVFRLLFIRLYESSNANLPADTMTGTLSLNGVEKPFNFKSLLPNAQGYVEVPMSGKLFLEVKLDKMLAIPEQTDQKPSEIVDKMVRKLRLTLKSEKVALAIFSIIRTIRIEYQWKQLLEGLSQDFILTPQQAEALFYTRSKDISCARDADGTGVYLIPCLLGTETIRDVARRIPSFRDLVRIHVDVAKLLMLNLENPTGHYSLNMAIPCERSVVERLLLLNRWETHLRLETGREDISEHGNSKNFRNEVSDGRSFIWEPHSWRVPNEHGLSFDYVSLQRPPADATPILDIAWGRVLDRICEALYLKQEEELPETPDLEETPVPSRPLSSCLEEAHMHDEDLDYHHRDTHNRRSSFFDGGLGDLRQVFPAFISPTKGSKKKATLKPRQRFERHKDKLAHMKSFLGIGAKARAKLGPLATINHWKHEEALEKRPSLFQYFMCAPSEEQPLPKGVYRREEPDSKDDWLSDADVLWALTCISSKLFLDCYQLRELLCILHRPASRANALVSLFARTIDWPVNGKMCRSKFCKTDWERIRTRIGCINTLNFMQLENTHVSYDLSVHEQRLACYVFCHMHFLERGRCDNLRELRIDWSGRQAEQNWSRFQAGLPISWERLECIPTRGIFEGRYVCSHETAKLRERRRLAAAIGGWVGLPEQDETLKDMLRLWSSIDDMPEALLTWMEFVMAHFAFWHQAFDACDEITDRSLTREEFVNGFKGLGFQLTPNVDEAIRMEAMVYLSEVCEAEDDDMPPEPWQMTTSKEGIGDKSLRKLEEHVGLETFELNPKRRECNSQRYVCRKVAPSIWKADPELEKRAVDVLIKSYHFLDPDGDMKVTEDEFGAITGLWREFKQSTWEFACHLRERFGSVEAAWRYAAAHEGDTYLDRKQFSNIAHHWDFEGPVQQTFTCIDHHRAGLINKQCWAKLEDADPPRRPGTRWTVTSALEQARQRHTQRQQRHSVRLQHLRQQLPAMGFSCM